MPKLTDREMKIAERAATELMTVGGPTPNIRADRLVLMRKGQNLGGWCFDGVRDKIAEAIGRGLDD